MEASESARPLLGDFLLLRDLLLVLVLLPLGDLLLVLVLLLPSLLLLLLRRGGVAAFLLDLLDLSSLTLSRLLLLFPDEPLGVLMLLFLDEALLSLDLSLLSLSLPSLDLLPLFPPRRAPAPPHPLRAPA